MNASQETFSRISLMILMEVVAAAKKGSPLHEQLGMSRETFNLLSGANIDEWYSLAGTPFLEMRINDRTLNLAIQHVLQSRDKDALLKDAMRNGASRDIMQLYAAMSHNDFNRLRQELQLEAIRRRPSRINEEDYAQLSALHSEYGTHHAIHNRLDHLRCLNHLAVKSGIDINRIYHYYYRENSNLFSPERGKARG